MDVASGSGTAVANQRALAARFWRGDEVDLSMVRTGSI